MAEFGGRDDLAKWRLQWMVAESPEPSVEGANKPAAARLGRSRQSRVSQAENAVEGFYSILDVIRPAAPALQNGSSRSNGAASAQVDQISKPKPSFVTKAAGKPILRRLLAYEGLQLVTLGLFLWQREPTDIGLRASKAGIKSNPLSIDNKQVLEAKLGEWRPTDLQDFAYQIEKVIHCSVASVEEVEQYLVDICDYLPGAKASKVYWDEQGYRQKVAKFIYKVLDNQEAGVILWHLVKDK